VASDVELWTFDQVDRIGGHQTHVEGSPAVIDSAAGPAVEFDGVDDALFVDVHPLAGARAFTWEAIFRPDGGQEAQRWFHLQESGTENRMLFELRVSDGKWYFDSYLHSGENRKALIDRNKVHPLLAWYHVAAVYDGREFRNYVNGVQEGAAEIHFDPQGPGRSSVGVRVNRVNYFKGAIHAARFTRRALSPGEFLKLSGDWKPVSFSAADGATVHGDLYGTGTRGVVLAHGGRFDKASWAEQAHALMKAGFRALAIDLRRDSGPKNDVLAAVRYLHQNGAKTVFVVGASFGGGAAAEASIEARPGEIDRLVLLAHAPIDAPEKMKGRKLFITARGDLGAGDTPRLPRIREQYERASDPKELVILESDAHAQFLFATNQRERLMREIARFLSEP
jgi:alpha/beta superfamily hydrolase